MQAAMLLGAGAQINGNEIQDVLDVVNMVLDGWNADRKMVYAEVQSTFTLTPNLNPPTLGPTGTFVVTQRPESVDSASLVDTTITPNVNLPLRVRDWQWYARLVAPDVTAIPTSLYYEPDWPNGRLFLYPEPSLAYDLNLWLRTVLSQLLLTDTFSLPAGYLEAITLTTAEYLCPMFQQETPRTLEKKAAEARVRLWTENIIIPHISTRDAGMPSGSGRHSSFFWPDGGWSSGNRG